eukprot:scaffold28465_cov17-Tisochrysis_lutea.AAC.1
MLFPIDIKHTLVLLDLMLSLSHHHPTPHPSATGSFSVHGFHCCTQNRAPFAAVVNSCKWLQQVHSALCNGNNAGWGVHAVVSCTAVEVQPREAMTPSLACCHDRRGVRAVVSCTAVKVQPKEGDDAQRSKYMQ